jgi:hypothetical protein
MRSVRETLPSAVPDHALTEAVIHRAFAAGNFSFVFAAAGSCTVIRVTPLHGPYDSLVLLSLAAAHRGYRCSESGCEL